MCWTSVCACPYTQTPISGAMLDTLHIIQIWCCVRCTCNCTYRIIPVVPARGGAEVALKIYIYKTFLIYRTCMRRAPAKPVRACTLRNWCLVSHVTFEAPRHTSHLTVFTLHTPHCTLHTALCALRTPHFTLHTPHFTLHTSHCTLPTAHSTLHTSHSTLHTSQSILHTSHSTLHSPHFTLHTSHCTLHAPHFTLHPSHSTLHLI